MRTRKPSSRGELGRVSWQGGAFVDMVVSCDVGGGVVFFQQGQDVLSRLPGGAFFGQAIWAEASMIGGAEGGVVADDKEEFRGAVLEFQFQPLVVGGPGRVVVQAI